MQDRRKIPAVFISIFIFFIFIIDAKTILLAASDGLDLCIQSVIPSLFPFLILSNIISTILTGSKMKFLTPLTKKLGIPDGAEYILLLGFLSGYPVGAQNINTMYKKKMISQSNARRMLSFCSNAGPAFIFGMLLPLFDTKAPLWALWGIHIISAIVAGLLFSQKTKDICNDNPQKKLSITESMNLALRAMAIICGWVLIFRIFIALLRKCLFPYLSATMSVLISGLLEISNGCILLNDLSLQGMRFIFCAFFLGIGGFCVSMQTLSVAQDVGIGFYFPGKITQSALSVLFAIILQYALFPEEEICRNWHIAALCAVLIIFIVLIYRKTKNYYSNLEDLVV